MLKMPYSLLVSALLMGGVCSIAISYQHDATKVSTEVYDGAQRVIPQFRNERTTYFCGSAFRNIFQLVCASGVPLVDWKSNQWRQEIDHQWPSTTGPCCQRVCTIAEIRKLCLNSF